MRDSNRNGGNFACPDFLEWIHIPGKPVLSIDRDLQAKIQPTATEYLEIKPPHSDGLSGKIYKVSGNGAEDSDAVHTRPSLDPF